MLETAFRTGTKLYVGHNMRHMPVVRQMREIIDSGAIGEVKAVWCRHFVGNGGDYYFKDWHAERKNTTGLLLQKGAHDIDVIHWLAGGYTERVTAVGGLAVYGDVESRRDRTDRRMGDWFSLENWPPTEQTGLNPVIDVEDISMMQMELDNGVLASYQQCHFTPDYWRNYTVIGTEGRLENFGDDAGNDQGVEHPQPGRLRGGRPRGGNRGRRRRPRRGGPAPDRRVPALRGRGRTDRDLAGRRPRGGCRGRAGHRVPAHRRIGQVVPALSEELLAYFAANQERVNA